MSAKFHLAQVNIGRLRAPIDHPMIKDFADNLDPINALAEASPGFVWRLTGDGNNATDLQPFDDALVAINMSVWTDVPSLGAYVYRSGHVQFMRRRREWFEHMDLYMVLWWVPAGHRPTIEEAKAKLALLEAHGPTPEAFTFKIPFPAPDEASVESVLDECA
ncbi:hypothetical protein J2800_003388 [Caulobacter rhizosphaerae]|uniref:DUF3291 domain-containing protein n=1 Tax=Caulobacter rhizosphaerae TaxID=2010972 RepID=A0ABU1N2F0_9CAUL|nr:DUF3291 domain-containing protein [Caulobacter rhizosphaerae]MDR6532630.1 hypothetical protein [Caulobacter rhizosphaerae]